jgi:hypothetical protein
VCFPPSTGTLALKRAELTPKPLRSIRRLRKRARPAASSDADGTNYRRVAADARRRSAA